MPPARSFPSSNIPVHRIDLSLPPKERYKGLALAYKSQISTITPLFNELLADLGIPEARHGSINTLARLLMRGVYSSIETAELRGICEVTGVGMYLLVALNVVLDLLMGCTSSAVRSTTGKLWHLRTLDWAMDPLRQIIVQLDFVRSGPNALRNAETLRSLDDCEVLASSITYVGFVGVLTGVKPGLSMSLNFRAVHNDSSRWGHFKFYAHHLAVLLGYRQSISSRLRELLYDDDPKKTSIKQPPTLAEIEKDLSSRHTTAAYLLFSDGDRSMVLEKDFGDAHVRWDAGGFLVATNHDFQQQDRDKSPTPAGEHTAKHARQEAMADLLEDSTERAECVSAKWRKKTRADSSRNRGVSQNEAISWVSDYPTTNECTHFATVMDPSVGVIRWAHAYIEPLETAENSYVL